MRQETEILEHHSHFVAPDLDQLVVRCRQQVFPVQQDLPVVRLNQPRQTAHNRGFARPRQAHNDKRLADMNVKAHIDGRGDMALGTHFRGQRLRRCAALMEKTAWIRPVDFPQISTREFDRAGHGQILNCNSAPA